MIDENQERLRRAVETGVLEPGPFLTIQIDEGERQMLLLALAVLTQRSPGFDYANSELAKKLNGLAMYKDFRKYNSNLGAAPVPMTDAMLADAKTRCAEAAPDSFK